MIDTKKEQERDELHRAIWAIADELRGAVDGWDFKNYVLGTMFYRYISENLCNYINSGEIEAGNVGFDFAKMSDEDAEEAREGLVEEKGFFILPSELFCNVRANAANDENLNETLERVFRHIEESAKGSEAERDFAGLFDDYDVNSNKLGSTVAKRNEKLVKLLNGVGEMNLGDVKDHSIDAFGDAYEYLMTMYASNAGKSGGEFFTPADVSELLTRLGTVGKTEINKVYDPACGSGSLLLKAEKILGKDAIRNGFYGQEINITVPTGNFGNILAAFYAKQMGLPIHKLICASNENRVLYDFFRTGTYDRKRDFILTTSPSMDILISSNLERLIYRLTGENAEKCAELMKSLSEGGEYTITDEMKAQLGDFYGNFCSEKETADAISEIYKDSNYVIDTHTAVAAGVYKKYVKDTGDKIPAVIASTASPYKFTRSVMDAISEGHENLDDFGLADALEKLSGVAVPKAVNDIRTAPVLHDRVVDAEDMPATVKEILKIS